MRIRGSCSRVRAAGAGRGRGLSWDARLVVGAFWGASWWYGSRSHDPDGRRGDREARRKRAHRARRTRPRDAGRGRGEVHSVPLQGRDAHLQGRDAHLQGRDAHLESVVRLDRREPVGRRGDREGEERARAPRAPNMDADTSVPFHRHAVPRDGRRALATFPALVRRSLSIELGSRCAVRGRSERARRGAHRAPPGARCAPPGARSASPSRARCAERSEDEKARRNSRILSRASAQRARSFSRSSPSDLSAFLRVRAADVLTPKSCALAQTLPRGRDYAGAGASWRTSASSRPFGSATNGLSARST